MIRNIWGLLIFALLGVVNVFAQENMEADETTAVDTICFKYDFKKDDVLVYIVDSRDSIVVDWGIPLFKERKEKVKITCDSVKPGIFYLSIVLTDFISYESSGAMKNVIRKSSPWLNRKIQIGIDSLGKRLSSNYSDSLNFANSNGGPFQPYMFFNLGSTCKAVHQSWMVKSEDILPENCIPPSIIRSSTLFRMANPIDTLNYACNQINFVKTGQGSFYARTTEQSMKSTVIINSGGHIRISKELNIPVNFFQTIEQKINLIQNDGKESEQKNLVNHFTNCNYSLESFTRNQKK